MGPITTKAHEQFLYFHCDWFSLPSGLCSFQAFSDLPEVRTSNLNKYSLFESKIEISEFL